MKNDYFLGPLCLEVFDKNVCKKFQGNFFYMDMMDYLDDEYGNLLKILVGNDENGG